MLYLYAVGLFILVVAIWVGYDMWWSANASQEEFERRLTEEAIARYEAQERQGRR
jgi:hypothetical protein